MSVRDIAVLSFSATLGGIGTNYPQSWWWLILFSVAGLIYLLQKSPGSYRRSFTVGASYGVAYILITLSYFWSAHPLDWAGVYDPWLSLGLVGFIWSASSIVLGVFVGLFAVAFSFFTHKQGGVVWNMIFGAFLWSIFEFLRSLAFSGFYYHEGVLIGPHWTFGFLGYTVAWSDLLLPLASTGGVYLLSSAGFLVSYLLYLVASDLVGRVKFGLSVLRPISLFVFTAFVFFFIPSLISKEVEGDEQLSVALISLYPNSEDEDGALTTRRLIEEVGSHKEVDLLVLTEYVNYLGSESFDSLEGVVGKGGVVIDSEIAYVDNTNKQALMHFYNNEGKKVGEYRKQLLIPNGEYLPLFVRSAAKLVGAAEWTTFFDSTRGYRPGEYSTPTNVGGKYIGALFCIEILSPDLYRGASQNGAKLLVNAASHSNFKGDTSLINQNLSMAKVRAVESGRYFAQSTSYGPAFVITQKGSIRNITPLGESAIMHVKIPLYDSITPYVVYGRYSHIILMVGLALLILLRLYMRPRQ